ncbi:MAG: AAA family ATPase [Melioribacteraceae bacterium]|nr:AAA family ATPase [Melioribacteraceae bacterium]MCF8355126.1 AAA family ATPase [Melioribacteraceae bacterium]MCF8392397.1 AAA family ATPase [Melioribacteraceae bacterium]MCF8417918.1 AAA family ATPase [Melioribacteraceae bacterium]
MEFYIPRLLKNSKQSFFLFGPRGTGKSTFLKHNYINAIYLDLLKPDEFRKYSARPERLIELVNGNPDRKTVIIDEIQKLPEILGPVHLLIEDHKDKQFIMTGSSARKLKKEGVDLLAGRAIKQNFHPFLFSEIKQHFSFEEIFQYGSIPIIITSEDRRSVLDSYVSLYIKEEVQLEGFVRNIGNFNRFLESISFSHGSLLNISNVARECQVERKVVENYIKILEDILLAYRVYSFTKKAKRVVVQHPKFYFFDTGVFRSLRPTGPFDKPEEISGAALEGLVFQNLKGWIDYSGKDLKIYFWRTKAGVEVDFILYGSEGIYAIEVKNSQSVRHGDVKSLKSFQKEYPGSNAILLYNGNEKIKIDDVLCIPVQLFLQNLYIDGTLDEML